GDRTGEPKLSEAILKMSLEERLLWAAKDGCFLIVHVSLNRGANIMTMAREHNTALHLAVMGGRLQIVQELLARRADIEAANAYGATPLHLAAVWGHEDVINIVLDHGANIRAVTMYGDTALDLALRNRHETIARRLVALENIEQPLAIAAAPPNGV
ncbi:MAG TPA: ankyrin repeat domain-containing protein, partial [Opitutales bacterium]|nr:ankyrin repeat domain-containing protein [Opitutales bacterium]